MLGDRSEHGPGGPRAGLAQTKVGHGLGRAGPESQRAGTGRFVFAHSHFPDNKITKFQACSNCSFIFLVCRAQPNSRLHGRDADRVIEAVPCN